MSGLENPLHLALLALLLLVLFGAKRLPEIGRSLGTGMREFRHSLGGDEHDTRAPTSSPPPNGDENARTG